VSVQTNKSDTEATGTCTIREQGLAFPAGCNRYVRSTRTSKTADGTVVTLTVSAQGSGAEARVLADAPGDEISSEVTENSATLEASATYVTEERPDASKNDPAAIVRIRRFSVSGGGRPRKYTPITGMARNWLTIGARRALYLQEEYTVRGQGPQTAADLRTESLLFPDNFDLEASRESYPQVVDRKLDKDSEIWERSATRVYVFGDGEGPTEDELFEAVWNSTRMENIALADAPDWEIG
jgi:hypothetical protein